MLTDEYRRFPSYRGTSLPRLFGAAIRRYKTQDGNLIYVHFGCGCRWWEPSLANPALNRISRSCYRHIEVDHNAD